MGIPRLLIFQLKLVIVYNTRILPIVSNCIGAELEINRYQHIRSDIAEILILAVE